jgi:hypothetical protein
MHGFDSRWRYQKSPVFAGIFRWAFRDGCHSVAVPNAPTAAGLVGLEGGVGRRIVRQ